MATTDDATYTALDYSVLVPSERTGQEGEGDVLLPVHGRRSQGGSPELQLHDLVEGDRFQSFIGLVILLNIFVLWGETDAPDWTLWAVLENVFLLIFLAEWILRIANYRLDFFCGKDKWWAYLDTSIICIGVFDLWLTPLCLSGNSASVAPASTAKSAPQRSNSSLLRFLRLMRLLRLLRVFKMFRQLMTFIQALRDMFGTFIWIFVVLSMFILTFAVSLTHLLGHGEALGPHGQLQEEHPEALATIQGYFKDVPTSLFTLFQLTTTDNWDDIALPLIEISPWWRLFFVFFIAFASWTMISVLTAVASNKMIAATADRKELEMREQERKYQAFIEFLRDSFLQADSDGNGVLDKDEFSTMISEEFVHQRMKELGVHMSRQELEKAWEMLDIDESGELTIDEFVTGLSTLQEGLATKHMVSVDYSLKRVTLRTEGGMDKLCRISEDLVRESTLLHERFTKEAFAEPGAQLSVWLQWRGQSEFGNWLVSQNPAA